MSRKYRFSIDRGGTFTDIFCEIVHPTTPPTTTIHVAKLLSEDPSHYPDAPREGIRRMIATHEDLELSSPLDIDTTLIEWIRMGTTVATNALLERKGEDVLLLTTRGFGDLLSIGNQSRPDIFDLVITKPSLLFKKVIEVDERILLGKKCLLNLIELEKSESESESCEMRIVEGVSNEKIVIETPLEVVALRDQLQSVLESGIRSVAILLLHSYTSPQHEIQLGHLCHEIGFEHVSLSHQVMPMIRAVPRGQTTLVDAYLSPILRRYVDSFASGFRDALEGVDVSFMQSDGGLTDARTFTGSRSIFSGPAGGVVGYSETAYDKETRVPLIGFDMGGTSTDVSRFAGVFEHVYDCEIAGVPLQIPQLDITTVAAGGGSCLFYKQGRFIVGPESAGAHPGPVCYGKPGGMLAITDANVVLGRIMPKHFPMIFGETEDQPLDVERSRDAFEVLRGRINAERVGQRPLSIEEVACGFIDVANEQMARPCASGGAAPQHACSIARLLGIRTVKIHKYSGILSAVGLSLASVVEESQEHCGMKLAEAHFAHFDERLDRLEESCKSNLDLDRYVRVGAMRYLNLRYEGTDYSVMTKLDDDEPDRSVSFTFKDLFERRYLKEYGFVLPGRDIIVDDLRVRLIAYTSKRAGLVSEGRDTSEILPLETTKMFVEGDWMETRVFRLDALPLLSEISGPAIILQDTSTVVVLPRCQARITAEGNIDMLLEDSPSIDPSTFLTEKPDPIVLSIFSHRFMSIAEQMGRTLQRTSISTNIKERLDFSCAVFGPAGHLVANAQFIPVHLGSMADAVTFQIEHLGDDWKEGEVIMTNHPIAGGTHLPDITIITPVYAPGAVRPIFYVASRGHHADIGGITPGSMPPFSKFLSDEGANVVSFKIVRDGEFQLDGVREILKDSRILKDNIADLKAQIAANQKGIELFQELIAEYTLPVVQLYMQHIQDNAEMAVREMLRSFVKKINRSVLEAEDFMDDGTRIALKVTIDDGTAIFDFTGTSPQVVGNTNAPKAVTASAVLYCLRCLVKEDIPLNYGCLKPIQIIVPENSILDPDAIAGVVGGNVLTSQRITDVVFLAFEAVAASQGCMNNFTFGSDFGYYETICGGSGAGDGWNGASAVHTHMTNTRITDVEILEERYPVILREFAIRRGSGGRGKYRGGDGVIRDFEFLEKLEVGILSERRVYSPYGLSGGGAGKKGENLYVKHPRGQVFNLGGKNALSVFPRDRVIIKSPGGGAFGLEEEGESE